MSKSKKELLDEAQSMGLEVTTKNTVAEIEAAIAGMSQTPVEPVESGDLEVAEAGEAVQAEEAKVAKAGKRSAKALAEAEEKQAKEDRKSSNAEAADQPKKPVTPTRPRAERRGKNYKKSYALVEKGKNYTLAEAIALAIKTSSVKFDATVELHVNLGVDPRQADQNIRATVSLPNGTGKTIRVAVFAPEADHAAAKKAGADIVGEDDFLKQLDKEELSFDTLVTTPQMMPRLGKYARTLGPRGLMPNPKSGTVATDVAKAVSEAKAGKVEYRVDKQAIVHLSIGKVSFGADKLAENAKAFFDSLQSQKPSSIKGAYVKSTNVSTTQGPGIKVENVVS